MLYRVEIKKKAEKEIKALPKKDQKRVIEALDVLRESPFTGKRLQGKYKGAWSFHVWPYRIIYTIHKEIVTVSVLRIGHRQGIYK